MVIPPGGSVRTNPELACTECGRALKNVTCPPGPVMWRCLNFRCRANALFPVTSAARAPAGTSIGFWI